MKKKGSLAEIAIGNMHYTIREANTIAEIDACNNSGGAYSCHQGVCEIVLEPNLALQAKIFTICHEVIEAINAQKLHSCLSHDMIDTIGIEMANALIQYPSLLSPSEAS